MADDQLLHPAPIDARQVVDDALPERATEVVEEVDRVVLERVDPDAVAEKIEIPDVIDQVQ